MEEDLPAGQLEGQRRGAGLALGGELLGAHPVQLHGEIVLVGAGQALPGLQLRLFVALLVGEQLGENLPRAPLRIGDGGHRLVPEIQVLPPAGEVPVDGGRHLPQAFDEVGPVVDEQGAGLGHAQIELIQGVQQGRVLLPVPEDAGQVLN